jgi:hypothetical protein
MENIDKFKEDIIRDEVNVYRGYVGELAEHYDSEFDYVVVDDILVSTQYKIGYDDITYKVFISFSYPDATMDQLHYAKFEDVTEGVYNCPNCDSNNIKTENTIEGKIHCRRCEWDNYNTY